MSILKREQGEEESNSSDHTPPRRSIDGKKSRSLLSLFRRESSSFGEVEGEVNPKSRRNSQSKSSVCQGPSLSSLKEEEEGNPYVPRRNKVKRSSTFFPQGRKERRSSLLLDGGSCDVTPIYQVMRCENFNMDSCDVVANTRQTKCLGIMPCLIALGAIIIIAIPLAKILGIMRRDLTDIHYELSGLKKQMGYEESQELSNTPMAKLSKECAEALKYLVREELSNFDSDKTGKIDFALESAGGRIVKTINTENYGSSVRFLGITLCEGSNGPRAMIQASNAAGECWAFKGSKGTALVKLLGKVRISAVSLEHISSKVSPTGKLDTAPKDFSVYGLVDLKQPKVKLGTFEYKTDSSSIQTFPLKATCDNPFEYVELHVESNHGSPDYTCVYRFRVHGTLDSL